MGSAVTVLIEIRAGPLLQFGYADMENIDMVALATWVLQLHHPVNYHVSSSLFDVKSL